MSEVIVAFDHGRARIGIATANTLTRTATPLTTLAAAAGLPSWTEIDRIIDEWHPTTLVVGLPTTPTDEVGRGIAAFVQALESRYGLPVRIVDESLTSRAAESDLIERRRRGGRRIRRTDVDMLAACLIAEQWISSYGE